MVPRASAIVTVGETAGAGAISLHRLGLGLLTYKTHGRQLTSTLAPARRHPRRGGAHPARVGRQDAGAVAGRARRGHPAGPPDLLLPAPRGSAGRGRPSLGRAGGARARWLLV